MRNAVTKLDRADLRRQQRYMTPTFEVIVECEMFRSVDWSTGGIHLDGHEVPAEDRGPAEAAVRAWFGRPGWRLYLALVDGTPAGSAALTVDAGLGYLANAATLPAMRGRGCQTALLARRIADAAAAGCDTVASLAEFGTGSQRNLERAGLRVAFTQAVWRMGP